METEVLSEVANVSSHLSIWSLIASSDFVIKIVIIGLLSASVWSWAIIIEKVGTMRHLKKMTKKFEENFWSGGSLDKLYDSVSSNPRDPMASMFVAAMREWKRSNLLKSKHDRGLRGVSLQQRIEKSMAVVMEKELDELETRMGFLATTGSVSPFVGLFGTVWGIMNSFSAMGINQNNSLATIAPGIAEALFTTALGLIAAIPAVVAYNKISSDVDRYARKLESFISEFSSILSREIDNTAIQAEIAGE
ncbi:MAG: protein TolQ [Lactobacillaceae bacterium]|jgi:biopolymer transport protein TolQ|nr:protein TolQ [Lactobacillaceae bacterium]